MIDSVLADGKRVTTVLPPGSIGNQQPITVLSEQWFAPDLEILVMTKHSDPRTGETTYSLSNITRGEPAAGLFDVPADYTIQSRATCARLVFSNPPSSGGRVLPAANFFP